MSETRPHSPQADNPLNAARLSLAQLISQSGSLDPAALKSELEKLKTLLDQAAQRGDGEDASQLRSRMDKLVQDTATFTSVMVHEVRRPMTSLRGYADMLAKPGMVGTLNEMQQQFIDTIRSNVLSMETLVSDISDVNKLNSGRLQLDAKMTTFGQVVLDAQKQLEAMIAKFGHEVVWDVPQGLPILNTDAKQLAKVLVKLVQNALQYTPQGSGKIVVKAERLDGNVLHVTITDNGIGMKPEELARLGEPFYRADHELVTSQKGYGLGIPVAMGLLHLMNGKLEYSSEPGKGSTFSFSIVGIG